MLQKNKLSHTTVPDTSFQSLTEFYVNGSAAVLSATKDTFSFCLAIPFCSLKFQTPYLQWGEFIIVRKKAVKKSSLSPVVVNEMSFEHFFPFPSITQPLVNRHSDETGLSWSNILRFFRTLCSILIYTVLCSDMVARFVNNLQARRYKTCLNLILILLIL